MRPRGPHGVHALNGGPRARLGEYATPEPSVASDGDRSRSRRMGARMSARMLSTSLDAAGVTLHRLQWSQALLGLAGAPSCV